MAEMKGRYRATPDTVQDKQWTDIRIDSTGALILSDNSSGTVAVTSLTPGTSATNLGKAEDAVHTTGDTGVMILGVRNDSAGSTFVSGNGDYSPIAVNNRGAIYTVDNANAYDVTLSTDTSAYTDGDVLADTQLVSSSFFNPSGVPRTLLNVNVLDKADQGFGIDLLFLDANVSLGTENAAPSITDANAASIVGVVRIDSGDWIDLGGARIASKLNVAQVLRSASANLYIAAIVRGAGTYGASDIIVTLGTA